MFHGRATPRIALTLGDPGGIGPEVCMKAAADPQVREACWPVIVGSFEVAANAAAAAGILRNNVALHRNPAEIANSDPDMLTVLDTSSDHCHYTIGSVAAANGAAAHRWICEAARLAIDAQVDAICTAPISKEALFAADFNVPGHTELLAELCGGCEVRMMLEGGGLHVALQTIHVPLAAVPALITTERILASLRILHNWSKCFADPEARIVVCGLNPHAGEAGHFGSEEIEIIAPAIKAAYAEGINATGPYPADTIFHRALNGDFDLILAMYHDQALIPVKTLDFHRGVNVTVGLPIIRTSPDHGTAFDIAGKGIANPSSMIAAILRAARLVPVTPIS